MKTRKKTTDKAVRTKDTQAKRERKARLLVIVACIGASAIAVVSFFFIGESRGGLQIQMPVTHDMHLHYEQMKSFHNGLSAGEIYPRWEEDTNRGFGAPTTGYYPPGVYYLTSAFYAISKDWTRSLLNLHLLMMIASAAAIYLYARRAMSRGAAVVAMISYIYLPYHLTDQYQRGAIAELSGFVWMPMMMLFADKFFDRSDNASQQTVVKRVKLSFMLMSGVGLAASLGAFLWSHPPTAYQFLLAFALFSLALAWMQKDFKGLLALGCAIVAGLALSAAYLYPAAIEADLIRSDYVRENWPYHQTYVFLRNQPYQQYHQRVLLWTLTGGFALFFMTEASYPIGRFIPRIDIGVFTWRMLSITTLAVALLAARAPNRPSKRAIRAQTGGLPLRLRV